MATLPEQRAAREPDLTTPPLPAALSASLLEASDAVDRVAAQIDRSRGILRCLAADRLGVRNAIDEDFGVISSIARGARDQLVSLHAELNGHARLRRPLVIFPGAQAHARKATSAALRAAIVLAAALQLAALAMLALVVVGMVAGLFR
jgi:hypothetical protein